MAGACLALSIIKPHLAFGPVVYACVVGLRQRQWKMLLGFFGMMLVMVLAMFAIRPQVWGEFFISIPESNPTKWLNATFDGFGCFLFGEWFRLISLLVAFVLLLCIVALAWRSRLIPCENNTAHAQRGALVLALWLAATPYAFNYDYILLIPGFIMALGAWLYRTTPRWWLVVFGWLALDVAYVVMKTWSKPLHLGEQHFFFIPLASLALTIVSIQEASISEKRGTLVK